MLSKANLLDVQVWGFHLKGTRGGEQQLMQAWQLVGANQDRCADVFQKQHLLSHWPCMLTHSQTQPLALQAHTLTDSARKAAICAAAMLVANNARCLVATVVVAADREVWLHKLHA